jgi:hypothetical protein
MISVSDSGETTVGKADVTETTQDSPDNSSQGEADVSEKPTVAESMEDLIKKAELKTFFDGLKQLLVEEAACGECSYWRAAAVHHLVPPVCPYHRAERKLLAFGPEGLYG